MPPDLIEHFGAAAPLYHGSLREIEPGTILTPEGRDPDGSIHSGDYVYATTSPESARYFASQKDTSPLTDAPVWVHRVEPVGDIEPHNMPGEDERFAHGNYRAKAFRVTDRYQAPGHYASLLEHFGAYYHGTDKEFGPGEVVEPGHESPRHDPGGKNIWMHQIPGEARSYGRHLYEVDPTGILYDDSGDGGIGSWSSTSPARVIRRIAAGEAFPNPYHGSQRFGGRPEFRDIWFHGTKGTPEFGERRGDADRMSQRPEEREMNSGWPQPNKLLGVHLSPLHEVAHSFVGSVSSQHGALVHARLHFSNPAHYPTEDHLNLAVAQWADKHYPHWHDDKLNGNLQWSYSDIKGTRRNWHEEHLPGGKPNPHGLSDDELAERNWGEEKPDHPRYFNRVAGHAQQVLQWHPHLPEILRGFTGHLRDRGHRGITYGNNVEGPYDTDAGRGGEAATKAIMKRQDWPMASPKHISAIAQPEDIETAHVEHIAPWREEPQPHERTWEDASDRDEPDEMRDRVLAYHRMHGGAYPSEPRQAVHTAAAGDYRYEHLQPESGTVHWVNAYHPDGRRVGDMTWHAHGDHRVSWIAVYDKDDRRKGIATGMWDKAREVDPQVSHNTSEGGQTDAGRSWAQTTSARIAALEVHDYEGRTGDPSHITRSEKGMIPTSAIAGLEGVKGEKPGEHRNRQGERWEEFKRDIAENGIRNPLFITRDYGEEPKISEGNHRRDVAVELGLSHVPAEIRYFGHAERQGLVHEAAHARFASGGDDFTERTGYVECDQGHRHWGPHGASFLLLRHTDPDDGTKRYLLQKRTSTGATDHGGTWALPGGALQHEGEDSYAAARREAREEMGPLPRMRHHHTVHDDHGGWFADTHVADVKDRFQPHGEAKTGFEAEGHAWFDHGEVQDLKDKGALHPGFAATWDKVRRSRVDKEAAAEPRYYYGTTGEHAPGDQIEHHYWRKYPDREDFRQNSPLFTTTDPALAGHIADLRGRQSHGQSTGRMYEVRPTGPLEPDATANPVIKGQSSWQTSYPLHVISEIPRHEWPADLSSWQAPKTAVWDTSGSEKTGLYVRFGHWPKDERSYSSAGGYKEDGVSAYDLDKHGDPAIDHGLDRGHLHDEDCEEGCDLDRYDPDNDPKQEMQGRIAKAERNRYYGEDRPSETAHLVRGEMASIGYDGEPLLHNVRRVGDWIDHRHLFFPGAKRHRLARDPYDEDYEQPEVKPPRHRTAAPDTSGPERWFHGTNHRFEPGETVDRRMMDDFYATTSAAVAKGYGEHVYEVKFSGPHRPDPEWPSPQRAKFYIDRPEYEAGKKFDPGAELVTGKSLLDSKGNTLLHGRPPEHQVHMSADPLRVVRDATDYARERARARDFI